MTSELDERVLEDRLAALEAARGWSPRVVSRLESRIRSGDDLALFRMNPLAYASETSMEEAEAIDLFLVASHVGLVDMDWIIVCLSCANTASSFRGLERLEAHSSCVLCQAETDVSLDDYLQVTFTVSPDVRAIAYHDRLSLDAEELVFRWHLSRDVRPTFAPLTYPQLLEEWTRYVGDLEAGESAEIELDLDAQGIAVRDVLHAATVLYLVEGRHGKADTTVVELEIRDGRLVDADRRLKAFPFRFPDTPDPVFLFPASATLPGGPTRLRVTNRMADRAAVWIHEYPVIPESFRPVEFHPVLTARRLLSTQTFRTLFRSHTLAASEGLSVADLTFLFSDLRDSTRMYDTIGDATAYDLVRRHFDALGAVIDEHRGAIVKTIGDAIMATFVDPADGVRAAIAMSERMTSFERGSAVDLELKIGLHRGHAIAVTSNDRLDYFGQTVNIAARIGARADAREICLSEDVYVAPGVDAVLRGRPSEREGALMKGVAEEIVVYRLSMRAAASSS